MSGVTDRTTWQGKFAILSPWLFDIIHAIKKDCKSEHLRLDPAFVQMHFSGLPMHRIGAKEMRDVYGQQILTGNSRIAEFIANRWMFRHMNIYRFFETALAKVNPDFDKISLLSDDVAQTLIDEAVQQFGRAVVICFVILNDVVVPEKVFENLQRAALEDLANQQTYSDDDEEQRIVLDVKREYEKKIDCLKKQHAQEIARLQHKLDQITAKKSSHA